MALRCQTTTPPSESPAARCVPSGDQAQLHGTLVSGGSAPFVNWCAALEVTAALLILIVVFLAVYFTR